VLRETNPAAAEAGIAAAARRMAVVVRMAAVPPDIVAELPTPAAQQIFPRPLTSLI
jgi:hypothetical protein